MRVLTSSAYWNQCGKANQVQIEEVIERAATSYFLVSSARVSGLAAAPRVSVRSMVIQPGSSVSQSQKTSRTISVLAPGSAV